MSKLRDLYNKVYRERGDFKRDVGNDYFDPTTNHRLATESWNEIDDQEDVTEISQNKKFQKNKVLGSGLIALGLVVFISIVVFLLMKFQFGAFDQDRVSISIEGAENVQSGTVQKYKITVNNNNRLALEGAVLKVEYPDQLKPRDENFSSSSVKRESQRMLKIDLGKIKKKGSLSGELVFDVFGIKNESFPIKASVEYRPERIDSIFRKDNQLVLNVQSSVISIDIFGANEVAQGDIIENKIIIKNGGKETFSRLGLKLIFPEGFSYLKSDNDQSQDGEGNFWLVSNLEPGKDKVIEFRGFLSGNPGSTKKIRAEVIDYSEEETETTEKKLNQAEITMKMIASRMDIVHIFSGGTENNIFKAGETVRVVIKFKNNTSQWLRDLILKEKLSGAMVDKKGIVLSGSGFYDSQNDEIVWKASDFEKLKALGPDEEAQISYSFTIRKDFIPASLAETNQTVRFEAEIESLDVNSPVFENKRIKSEEGLVKIASELNAQVKGAYNDGEMAGSGPLPLEVGKETVFTMRIVMTNKFNALKNALVKINLPSGVIWKNNFEASIGEITFNERTNQAIWKIEEVPAGAGFFLDPIFSKFQIGLVPSENQLTNGRESNIVLINTVEISATDKFTEKEFSLLIDKVSTNSIEDY